MKTAMALRRAVLQKGDRADITSVGTADGDIDTSVDSVPPAPSPPGTCPSVEKLAFMQLFQHSSFRHSQKARTAEQEAPLPFVACHRPALFARRALRLA